MFKLGLAAAIAAASLVAAPVAAQSNAAKLSVASAARAGAPVTKSNKAVGGTALIGALVFVAVVAAIYFLAESEDDPVSA